MGDKNANCRRAVELLKQGVRVVKVSSLYYTEPVGFKEQEDFINAVAAVETDSSPAQLLALCQSIEERMGRKRTVRWGPRVIDLDILLYGDAVVNDSNLTIPHPLMTARRFVLAPLSEIAPRAVHPVLKKNMQQLLEELKDNFTVLKCGPDRRLP